ncbi:hypothetical protein DFH08DRAFT_986961 [Mycena albidolilacea]|uniref:Uncharacterized protein n=1 Tax=Mycena albidolilacea TaxID=1033008 RepID=A0AAD7E8J0_9AGAR|nr:hypothetical protein DFH08DRAFT_986961 [Mycena albidolilacea]
MSRDIWRQRTSNFISRVALGDTTNHINTAAPPKRTAKRKRKVPANTESNSRRRLDNDPDTEAPAIFGVGPSTASADAASAASKNVFHPAFANIPGLNLGSRLTKSDKNTAGASDVGYFVRGMGNPRHIEQAYTWGARNLLDPRLYNRLVKRIAVDDQCLDVVDCPELRNLMLFIGAQLDDGDIPHRTKLSQLISTRFRAEYTAIIREIKNALGRVAFTDDVCLGNLGSHLAITAHYIIKDSNGNLVLKTQLVAFRRLEGSHTGDNLGNVFVQVMKEIGCLHKVGTLSR